MLRMKIKQGFMCISALLLASCAAVGPDYQAPEVNVPEAWNHQLGQNPNSPKDLSRWWENFNDPELSSLIERASTGSFDLQIALTRIDEAEAQYGVAASQYYPTVDAIAVTRRSRIGSNVTGLLPSRTDNFEAIGSSLNWELDLFGRIRRQTEAAEANVAASVENYRDVLVVLNAEVARTYTEVRTLQKRLDLANKNVANQRKTLKIVQARYRSELTSELDVNQAEQNLASSESTIPLISSALARSINRLAVLLGQQPGTLNKELAEVKTIPSTLADITLMIPRDIVRQRPDIRRAERQLAAQSANIGVATADLYPRLSLTGLLAFSASSGSLLSNDSKLWSFGPNLSWNVFGGGRTRSRIEIANAQAERARAAYEKTVLGAFEDVEAGLINYSEERKRLSYLEKSVASAKKTVKIARSQYKNGLTNFQTVLDAERVLFAEEDRFADSEGALVRYLIGIYRAMGGGWEIAANNDETQKGSE